MVGPRVDLLQPDAAARGYAPGRRLEDEAHEAARAQALAQPTSEDGGRRVPLARAEEPHLLPHASPVATKEVKVRQPRRSEDESEHGSGMRAKGLNPA